LAEKQIEVALRGRRRRGPEPFVVGQVAIALIGDSEPILVRGQFYKYWILGAIHEQDQALRLLAAVQANVAARGLMGRIRSGERVWCSRRQTCLGQEYGQGRLQ
jgi:hypothetical protein